MAYTRFLALALLVSTLTLTTATAVPRDDAPVVYVKLTEVVHLRPGQPPTTETFREGPPEKPTPLPKKVVKVVRPKPDPVVEEAKVVQPKPDPVPEQVVPEQVQDVPAQQPGGAKLSDDDAAFRGAVVNSTNFFRTQHSAPWAHWNETLATYASNHLNGNQDCVFEHTGGPYGENLAMGYPDVAAAIDGWGNERNLFDFGSGGFSGATGHFTSMVWKASTTVGCARRTCKSGQVFLMCEYWPAGNVEGQYREFVGKQINGTRSRASRHVHLHRRWRKAGMVGAVGAAMVR